MEEASADGTGGKAPKRRGSRPSHHPYARPGLPTGQEIVARPPAGSENGSSAARSGLGKVFSPFKSVAGYFANKVPFVGGYFSESNGRIQEVSPTARERAGPAASQRSSADGRFLDGAEAPSANTFPEVTMGNANGNSPRRNGAAADHQAVSALTPRQELQDSAQKAGGTPYCTPHSATRKQEPEQASPQDGDALARQDSADSPGVSGTPPSRKAAPSTRVEPEEPAQGTPYDSLKALLRRGPLSVRSPYDRPALNGPEDGGRAVGLLSSSVGASARPGTASRLQHTDFNRSRFYGGQARTPEGGVGTSFARRPLALTRGGGQHFLTPVHMQPLGTALLPPPANDDQPAQPAAERPGPRAPAALSWTPMRSAAGLQPRNNISGLKRGRGDSPEENVPLASAGINQLSLSRFGDAAGLQRRTRQRSAPSSAERRPWRAGGAPLPPRGASAGATQPLGGGGARSGAAAGSAGQGADMTTETARRILMTLDSIPADMGSPSSWGSSRAATAALPSRAGPIMPPTASLGSAPAMPCPGAGPPAPSSPAPLSLQPPASLWAAEAERISGANSQAAAGAGGPSSSGLAAWGIMPPPTAADQTDAAAWKPGGSPGAAGPGEGLAATGRRGAAGLRTSATPSTEKAGSGDALQPAVPLPDFLRGNLAPSSTLAGSPTLGPLKPAAVAAFRDGPALAAPSSSSAKPGAAEAPVSAAETSGPSFAFKTKTDERSKVAQVVASAAPLAVEVPSFQFGAKQQAPKAAGQQNGKPPAGRGAEVPQDLPSRRQVEAQVLSALAVPLPSSSSESDSESDLDVEEPEDRPVKEAAGPSEKAGEAAAGAQQGPAPAAKPAASGWGAAFLQQNKASTEAAAKAVEEVINKEKGVGTSTGTTSFKFGIPTPAPAPAGSAASAGPPSSTGLDQAAGANGVASFGARGGAEDAAKAAPLAFQVPSWGSAAGQVSQESLVPSADGEAPKATLLFGAAPIPASTAGGFSAAAPAASQAAPAFNFGISFAEAGETPKTTFSFGVQPSSQPPSNLPSTAPATAPPSTAPSALSIPAPTPAPAPAPAFAAAPQLSFAFGAGSSEGPTTTGVTPSAGPATAATSAPLSFKFGGTGAAGFGAAAAPPAESAAPAPFGATPPIAVPSFGSSASGPSLAHQASYGGESMSISPPRSALTEGLFGQPPAAAPAPAALPAPGSSAAPAAGRPFGAAPGAFGGPAALGQGGFGGALQPTVQPFGATSAVPAFNFAGGQPAPAFGAPSMQQQGPPTIFGFNAPPALGGAAMGQQPAAAPQPGGAPFQFGAPPPSQPGAPAPLGVNGGGMTMGQGSATAEASAARRKVKAKRPGGRGR